MNDGNTPADAGFPYDPSIKISFRFLDEYKTNLQYGRFFLLTYNVIRKEKTAPLRPEALLI